jgi:hypothetical protein
MWGGRQEAQVTRKNGKTSDDGHPQMAFAPRRRWGQARSRAFPLFFPSEDCLALCLSSPTGLSRYTKYGLEPAVCQMRQVRSG